MNMNTNRTQWFLLLLIFALLVLTIGCAGSTALTRLPEDIFDEEQEIESVAFWRVQMIDRTSSIKSSPRFYIYHPAKADTIENDLGGLKRQLMRLPVDWTKKEGASYIEDLVVAEPGTDEYLFKEFDLYLFSDTFTNLWTGRKEVRDIYFTGTMNRKCTIPSDKLAYLGRFTIEFTGMRGNDYVYRTHLSQDSETFDDDVKLLRQRYPNLFERFEHALEAVPCTLFFVEDFKNNNNHWPLETRKKYASVRLTNGTLIIHAKRNKCQQWMIRPHFPMPERYDVELVSAWDSGEDDKGYGFTLGRDRRNNYNFYLSGNGRASAGLTVKGQHQSDLVAWSNNAGNAGKGSTNRQKIEVRGDSVSYSVNDAVLGTFEKELAFGNDEWAFGVTVCGKETVRFHRLVITER